MTPVVFVPGLLSTAEQFASQMTALWPYGPVTCANTREGDSMATIAAAILRDAPPTFALVGISMGGYLSFEILRQARERVTKLALLDTSARPDTPEATANRRAMIAAADDPDFAEKTLAPTLDALVHSSHVSDPRYREFHLRMFRAVGPAAYKRQHTAIMGRPDSRPELAAIRVPTVMIVGDEDQLTPVERAKEIADGISGARLVVVPEAGHASPIEQPEFVNRVLVEWIS